MADQRALRVQESKERVKFLLDKAEQVVHARLVLKTQSGVTSGEQQRIYDLRAAIGVRETLRGELEQHRARRGRLTELHNELNLAEERYIEVQLDCHENEMNLAETQQKIADLENHLNVVVADLTNLHDAIPRMTEQEAFLMNRIEELKKQKEAAALVVAKKKEIVKETEENLNYIMNAGMTSAMWVDSAMQINGQKGQQAEDPSKRWMKLGAMVTVKAKPEDVEELTPRSKEWLVKRKLSRAQQLWRVAYNAMKLGFLSAKIPLPPDFFYKIQFMVHGGEEAELLRKTQEQLLGAQKLIQEQADTIKKLERQVKHRAERGRETESKFSALTSRYEAMRIELAAARSAISELGDKSVEQMRKESQLYEIERKMLYSKLYGQRNHSSGGLQRKRSQAAIGNEDQASASFYAGDIPTIADSPLLKGLQTTDSDLAHAADVPTTVAEQLEGKKKSIRRRCEQFDKSPTGTGFLQRQLDGYIESQKLFDQKLRSVVQYSSRVQRKLELAECVALHAFDSYSRNRFTAEQEIERVMVESQRVQKRLLEQQQVMKHQLEEQIAVLNSTMASLHSDYTSSVANVKRLEDRQAELEGGKAELEAQVGQLSAQLTEAQLMMQSEDVAQLDAACDKLKVFQAGPIVDYDTSIVRILPMKSQRGVSQLVTKLLQTVQQFSLATLCSIQRLAADSIRRTPSAIQHTGMVAAKLSEGFDAFVQLCQRIGATELEAIGNWESYRRESSVSVDTDVDGLPQPPPEVVYVEKPVIHFVTKTVDSAEFSEQAGRSYVGAAFTDATAQTQKAGKRDVLLETTIVLGTGAGTDGLGFVSTDNLKRLEDVLKAQLRESASALEAAQRKEKELAQAVQTTGSAANEAMKANEERWKLRVEYHRNQSSLLECELMSRCSTIDEQWSNMSEMRNRLELDERRRAGMCHAAVAVNTADFTQSFCSQVYCREDDETRLIDALTRREGATATEGGKKKSSQRASGESSQRRRSSATPVVSAADRMCFDSLSPLQPKPIPFDAAVQTDALLTNEKVVATPVESKKVVFLPPAPSSPPSKPLTVSVGLSPIACSLEPAALASPKTLANSTLSFTSFLSATAASKQPKVAPPVPSEKFTQTDPFETYFNASVMSQTSVVEAPPPPLPVMVPVVDEELTAKTIAEMQAALESRLQAEYDNNKKALETEFASKELELDEHSEHVDQEALRMRLRVSDMQQSYAAISAQVVKFRFVAKQVEQLQSDLAIERQEKQDLARKLELLQNANDSDTDSSVFCVSPKQKGRQVSFFASQIDPAAPVAPLSVGTAAAEESSAKRKLSVSLSDAKQMKREREQLAVQLEQERGRVQQLESQLEKISASVPLMGVTSMQGPQGGAQAVLRAVKRFSLVAGASASAAVPSSETTASETQNLFSEGDAAPPRQQSISAQPPTADAQLAAVIATLQTKVNDLQLQLLGANRDIYDARAQLAADTLKLKKENEKISNALAAAEQSMKKVLADDSKLRSDIEKERKELKEALATAQSAASDAAVKAKKELKKLAEESQQEKKEAAQIQRDLRKQLQEQSTDLDDARRQQRNAEDSFHQKTRAVAALVSQLHCALVETVIVIKSSVGLGDLQLADAAMGEAAVQLMRILAGGGSAKKCDESVLYDLAKGLGERDCELLRRVSESIRKAFPSPDGDVAQELAAADYAGEIPTAMPLTPSSTPPPCSLPQPSHHHHPQNHRLAPMVLYTPPAELTEKNRSPKKATAPMKFEVRLADKDLTFSLCSQIVSHSPAIVSPGRQKPQEGTSAPNFSAWVTDRPVTKVPLSASSATVAKGSVSIPSSQLDTAPLSLIALAGKHQTACLPTIAPKVVNDSLPQRLNSRQSADRRKMLLKPSYLLSMPQPKEVPHSKGKCDAPLDKL